MSGVERLCRGCETALPPKHLRTQLAPPDSKWHEVRTHGLSCLLDFLDREEGLLVDGDETEVPWPRAPAEQGSGTVPSGSASHP